MEKQRYKRGRRKQKPKWIWPLLAGVIILFVVIGIVVVKLDKDEKIDLGISDVLEAVNDGEEKVDAEDSEEENTEEENTEEDTDEDVPEVITTEAAQTLIPTNPDGTYQKDDGYESGDISCSGLAIFSGQFVEDGRDELVENVAAIQVTNNSEEFLDLATLLYDLDGQTATFVATGIPSGKTAWVMEKSRMKAKGDSAFTYKGSTTVFKSNVASSTDQISVAVDGNNMIVTNNSDKEMETIVVYYKVLHEDGNYFGGITYVTDFQNVKAGNSAQSMAGHYKEGKTEIVRIDWK